jgi:arsenate-mycothiol transferase
MPTPERTPSVLFACVKTGGTSQIAAGLMRKLTEDSVAVYSAGTKPADEVNKLSAESLAEVGIDVSTEKPKPVDPELVRGVDIIVTLGREAHVEPVARIRFEN